MTDAGKEIIEIFKTKKSFTLAGNKEFYVILEYEEGSFFLIEGETFGNRETGRTKISETKAKIKIKEYFKQHSLSRENKSISTDDEILEYWKQWKYEG